MESNSLLCIMYFLFQVYEKDIKSNIGNVIFQPPQGLKKNVHKHITNNYIKFYNFNKSIRIKMLV